MFCLSRQSIDLLVFPSSLKVLNLILLPNPKCMLNTNGKELTLPPNSLYYLNICYFGYSTGRMQMSC